MAAADWSSWIQDLTSALDALEASSQSPGTGPPTFSKSTAFSSTTAASSSAPDAKAEEMAGVLQQQADRLASDMIDMCRAGVNLAEGASAFDGRAFVDTIQRLVAITNVPSVQQQSASVGEGMKKLVGSGVTYLQTLQQYVQTPVVRMQGQVHMALEQLEGAVGFLQLASSGRITDMSCSALLASAGQRLEDRLMDTMHHTRQLALRMPEELSGDLETNAGKLYVASQTALSTLKFVARLVLDAAAQRQLIETCVESRKQIAVLRQTAEKCAPRAPVHAHHADVSLGAMDRAVGLLESSVHCAEGERREVDVDMLQQVRIDTRHMVAHIVFLLNACQNVLAAVPHEPLQQCWDEAEQHLQSVLELLRDAATAGGLSAHMDLVRRSPQVAEVVRALIKCAQGLLPEVQKIGSTENLERRMHNVIPAMKPLLDRSGIGEE